MPTDSQRLEFGLSLLSQNVQNLDEPCRHGFAPSDRGHVSLDLTHRERKRYVAPAAAAKLHYITRLVLLTRGYESKTLTRVVVHLAKHEAFTADVVMGDKCV